MAVSFSEFFTSASGGGPTDPGELPTEDKYAANAAIAVQMHQSYFGQTVEMRSNANAAWVEIKDVVVHSEKMTGIKTSRGYDRVATRSVFVTSSLMPTKKFLSDVRIGTTVYKVNEVTARAGNRYELHLTRTNPVEVARPGYRK